MYVQPSSGPAAQAAASPSEFWLIANLFIGAVFGAVLGYVGARIQARRQARDARQEAAKSLTTVVTRPLSDLRSARMSFMAACAAGDSAVRLYFKGEEGFQLSPSVNKDLDESLKLGGKLPHATLSKWYSVKAAIEQVQKRHEAVKQISALPANKKKGITTQTTSYQSALEESVKHIVAALKATRDVAASDTQLAISHLIEVV